MLNSFSSEIIDLIVFYLGYVPPPRLPDPLYRPPPTQGLSRYATISKGWQSSIERCTLSAIKATGRELPRLKEIVVACPRRKSLLRALSFEIELPPIEQWQQYHLERIKDHKANIIAFQDGLKALWTELSNFPDTGIRLALSAEARGGTGETRWEYPEHSLTLPDADLSSGDQLLPNVGCITSLHIAQTGRRIHPSAMEVILPTLPNLRHLDIKIWPIQPKNREIMAEHRVVLARALESPTLEKLESLTIWHGEYTPSNHNFQTALGYDPCYPKGDLLNRAICKLAQRSLRELCLDESWPVSPALWGTIGDEEEKPFPHLRKITVHFPAITYDGRWLYTGDPNSVEAAQDEPVDPGSPRESEADSASDSSFNVTTWDEIDEVHEEFLNGSLPMRQWRVKPDPAMFDPLVHAMAMAALRMPNLEHLKACVSAIGMAECEIYFEYVQAGTRAQVMPYFEQTAAQLERDRWVVVLAPGVEWELPNDTKRTMQQHLGQEGEVIIYKY